MISDHLIWLFLRYVHIRNISKESLLKYVKSLSNYVKIFRKKDFESLSKHFKRLSTYFEVF